MTLQLSHPKSPISPVQGAGIPEELSANVGHVKSGRTRRQANPCKQRTLTQMFGEQGGFTGCMESHLMLHSAARV